MEYRELLQNYQNDRNQETRAEEILKKINQIKKHKEKMLQLFTADLISLNEFQEKTEEARSELPRLESELEKLRSISFENKNSEKILDEIFRDTPIFTDIHTFSNAQMREIIQQIQIDKNGNIDVYLNVLHPC